MEVSIGNNSLSTLNECHKPVYSEVLAGVLCVSVWAETHTVFPLKNAAVFITNSKFWRKYGLRFKCYSVMAGIQGLAVNDVKH